MLFLAVFCGFLAEYQLEHKIEKDREKQYIESMIDDVKEDAIKINKSISFCTEQVAAIDTLIQNIYHRPYTDSSLKMMYYLVRKYAAIRSTVNFTKRTITQLSNSGGLRLIRNKQASDSIVLYQEATLSAETQADYFVGFRMGKVNDFTIKLFDTEYLMNYDRNTIRNILISKDKIALLNNDPQLMKEFANALFFAKGTLLTYIALLERLSLKSVSVSQFLAETYHIENTTKNKKESKP